MTVEQFEDQLASFGESIRDLSPVLNRIAEDVTAQIRSAAPVDTGRLRQSINAFVSANSLEITMLYYGAFQNYGVNGVQDNIADKVEFGISQRPSSEPFYAFKTRRFGLAPQRFFNLDDLQELVAQRVETELLQQL